MEKIVVRDLEIIDCHLSCNTLNGFIKMVEGQERSAKEAHCYRRHQTLQMSSSQT